jgi:uncharacterized membrane protein
MTGSGQPVLRRRGYIDWMRGLAILVMVEAHVVDAWTRPTDRQTLTFGYAAILGGFAAPLFLFLAGVAVVLSATAKARKSGVAAGAAAVRRRGWEIFGLAFLFRLQAFLLNPGASPAGLLKVDILNIMGPAIVAAAAIWGRVRSERWRLVAFGCTTLAVTLLTPVVRTTHVLDLLPGPLLWYLRPPAGRAWFAAFPWVGFVFAGAFVGVLMTGAREEVRAVRLHAGLLVGGAALVVSAYAGSYLPSIYASSSFWTTSPAFFLLRAGMLTALLGLAFFGERIASRLAPGRWTPMQRFGHSSLFVYWIHVEMVYGWFSQGLHKNLSAQTALLAYGLFTLFLFALVVLKERVMTAARQPRAQKAPAGVSS